MKIPQLSFGFSLEPIESPYKKIIEGQKRQISDTAINDILPKLKEGGADKAEIIRFCRILLEDIQQGNNPDLEGVFRSKIEELGIQLR